MKYSIQNSTTTCQVYTLNVSIVECMGRVVDVECVCTLYIYMYRPMALVVCSTCIMLRTPRVLGHGYVPLMDPRALDAG